MVKLFNRSDLMFFRNPSAQKRAEGIRKEIKLMS